MLTDSSYQSLVSSTGQQNAPLRLVFSYLKKKSNQSVKMFFELPAIIDELRQKLDVIAKLQKQLEEIRAELSRLRVSVERSGAKSKIDPMIVDLSRVAVN